jgi:hypothetical protein
MGSGSSGQSKRPAIGWQQAFADNSTWGACGTLKPYLTFPIGDVAYLTIRENPASDEVHRLGLGQVVPLVKQVLQGGA